MCCIWLEPKLDFGSTLMQDVFLSYIGSRVTNSHNDEKCTFKKRPIAPLLKSVALESRLDLFLVLIVKLSEFVVVCNFIALISITTLIRLHWKPLTMAIRRPLKAVLILNKKLDTVNELLFLFVCFCLDQNTFL